MAYIAPCLLRLRAEVNAAWPGRDRTSDGAIGDTSHLARKSDHNPDPPVTGVVRALDIDVDGIPEDAVIAAMLRHPATNYVIFAGRIWQRSYGFAPRPYTGPNPHNGHVHLSIRRGYENAGGAWLTTLTGNTTGGGGSLPGDLDVTAPKPIEEMTTMDDELRGAIHDLKLRDDARNRQIEAVRGVAQLATDNAYSGAQIGTQVLNAITDPGRGVAVQLAKLAAQVAALTASGAGASGVDVVAAADAAAEKALAKVAAALNAATGGDAP